MLQSAIMKPCIKNIAISKFIEKLFLITSIPSFIRNFLTIMFFLEASIPLRRDIIVKNYRKLKNPIFNR